MTWNEEVGKIWEDYLKIATVYEQNKVFCLYEDRKEITAQELLGAIGLQHLATTGQREKAALVAERLVKEYNYLRKAARLARRWAKKGGVITIAIKDSYLTLTPAAAILNLSEDGRLIFNLPRFCPRKEQLICSNTADEALFLLDKYLLMVSRLLRDHQVIAGKHLRYQQK